MSAWRSSFHGGHSGQFCDHAKGSLREMIEAAIEKGIKTYGLSEHSPRFSEDQIFSEEKENGYDVDKLIATFLSYIEEAFLLQKEYKDRINIFVGFETEYISEDYLEKMKNLRREGAFDYIIGSVHHVNEICIDAKPEWTQKAIESCGGIENFAINYYQSIARLVMSLKPQIVGHIDLIKKCLDEKIALDSQPIKNQMCETLKVISDNNCALDLNVYPFRKGKSEPYPAPWIVQMAHEMNIPFAFGDDSHSPDTVGVGLDEGRDYLLSLGVEEVQIFEWDEAEGCSKKKLRLKNVSLN